MGLFSPVIRTYLEQHAVQYASGDLLDVGCGAKPYRELFSNVSRYVGTDHESEVDTRRANMPDRAQSIDVYADAERLPFEAESFDTVVATQLIEHLPHPGVFASEASRVLRAGGHLILTFPLVNQLHEEPHDYFRFTEHGTRVLCEEAGLRVIKTVKMGGAWLTVGYLLRDMILVNASRRRNRFSVRLLSRLGHAVYDVCRRLERWNPLPHIPLNYLVVVHKPAGSGAERRDRLQPEAAGRGWEARSWSKTVTGSHRSSTAFFRPASRILSRLHTRPANR